MNVQLEEILQKQFKFQSFRQGQREVVTSILAGHHTMAMLPTGSGKSLCYQLPGYVLQGAVIIVSPLLSLMQDQVEQIQMRGEKRVVALNSFLNRYERTRIMQNLERYKFIFISPEMLSMQRVLEKLQQLKIALFVVDEAHCISQWGYDFRPDYMRLGKVREQLNFPLTLALTATATKEVMADIVESLDLQSWQEFIFSVDRPNIAIKVEQVTDFAMKKARLLELVASLEGPGIIYFSSKKLAEEMAALLKENGHLNISAYHGGMDQESRIIIQQQFIHDQLECICATSAFGMGINKPNIRYVIHFHMPLQLESYLQEIGRAGRDGQESIAILLYCDGDEQLPLQLVESELPSESQLEFIKAYMHELDSFGQAVEINYEQLWERASLTETQVRMTEEFLLHGKEATLTLRLEKFKNYIEARNHIKRQKVSEILTWIQVNSCRREKILNYFAEQKTIEVENCCDCCGFDIHLFQKAKRSKASNASAFQWKEYLAAILKSK